MDIQNARFTNAENTMISATVDGREMNIPAVAGNRHYAELQRQGIISAPYTPPPDLTDAEVDAQMDAVTGQPEMLSILEAIADKLPGPTSVNEIRAGARARGRINMPRN